MAAYNRHSCDSIACFGCIDRTCTILRDARFFDRPCPFFKTREQMEEERAVTLARLIELKENWNYVHINERM